MADRLGVKLTATLDETTGTTRPYPLDERVWFVATGKVTHETIRSKDGVHTTVHTVTVDEAWEIPAEQGPALLDAHRPETDERLPLDGRILDPATGEIQ